MSAGGVQHERHPRPGPNDSYMARLGARLVDNGYPVLPIMPGTKKPGLFKGGAWRDYPGWTKHGSRPTSEDERVVWSGWPDAGIGIACGTVVGIDIDIEDAKLACDVEQLAGERLCNTPALRIGPRAQAHAGLSRARARLLQAGAARGARARPSVRRLRHPS